MEGPKGRWSSAELQTGSQIVNLEGPGPGYHQVATLEVDTHDKLVLSAGGHSLALGSRAGTLSGGDGPIPAFAAEPGDTTHALRKVGTRQTLQGRPRISTVPSVSSIH